ncbi:membrane hypothetical protein [uncultured Desulfobacterium sp.]|uniref:Uncharacterized protein n=1 Tax=uncultured Desulfobacterium sp. TaxID=201089 RepID=A0A445MX55_9BACT|nr:membrane hypothetical protein [uncultured Desulfobacterium sp.]
MQKRIYQILSIFLFVVVFGCAVLKGQQLWSYLHNIRWKWAVAGLGIYLINYSLRALRINIVSRQRLKIWPSAIHSACLHGVATYFLPFRSGDLTLPVILKSVANIGLTEGGQILLKVRFLDFFTLGLWMLCMSLLTPVLISPLVRLIWFLIALGMSLFPLMTKWLQSLDCLARLSRLKAMKIFENVASFGALEIVVSLGIWMAVASCYFCTARAINLNIGIGDIWFLITIQLPLQLIPVQGFANAGNHEGGWIAGLALLGIPTSEGMNFALASHAVLIVYVLALGVMALLTGKRITMKE